ncbi:conjugal transfer protein [Saccharolobus caldissimus]|nr:conjugal transfer protein [Saccharolobus caldissimus]
MGNYIEIPFVTLRGYSIPLLKTEIECPKLGGNLLIYALPDTGSRFSLMNKRTLNECFDNLEERYLDTVIITNLNLHTKRYKLKFHFVELNKDFEIPVAIADFGEIGGMYPSLILGREDFFSRVTICFDKNTKLIIKIDDY